MYRVGERSEQLVERLAPTRAFRASRGACERTRVPHSRCGRGLRRPGGRRSRAVAGEGGELAGFPLVGGLCGAIPPLIVSPELGRAEGRASSRLPRPPCA